MRKFLIVFLAEFRKSKTNYYGSFSNIISLFVWPIIDFFVIYFTYQSFNLELLEIYNLKGEKDLFLFLLLGVLAYNSFWCMVQGGIQLQNERQNGTLEIAFMSPANRITMLYGRSIGGFIHSIWMISIFSIFTFLYILPFSFLYLFKLILVFGIILISSIIWGGFISSIFLISRDSNILFIVLSSPMNFFSGVSFPIYILPKFLLLISGIYPLTYLLLIVRNIFLNTGYIKIGLIGFFIMNTIIFLLTKKIIIFAENTSKENGNFNLY